MIEIRPLAARDSFENLTTLLHQAHAPLAAQGLNFAAAAQDVRTTRQRAAEGQCFVATRAGEVVGTVTVCGPADESNARWSDEAPWFRDRNTAHFHQFGVAPTLQGQGLGRRLIKTCEDWARASGFRRMVLDTAETELQLRGLYRYMGYADVGQVHWEGRTYCSVVMLKNLDNSPLRDHLLAMARYNLWATQRLLAQVDQLPEADYRRDAGLFFKSVHGTFNHLLVSEQLQWLARFSQQPSPALALDAEAEADRARLRSRLSDGARAWMPLIEGWPEERFAGTVDYPRTDGQPRGLPFAASLAHVFNHSTHHRGQISAALTAMGHPCPALDLVTMLQDEANPP